MSNRHQLDDVLMAFGTRVAHVVADTLLAVLTDPTAQDAAEANDIAAIDARIKTIVARRAGAKIPVRCPHCGNPLPGFRAPESE